MNCENRHDTEMEVLMNEANRLEKDWTDESDDNRSKAIEVPSQFPENRFYWAMGWKPQGVYFQNRGSCDRCGTQSSISLSRVSAGCRFNGDGYGTYFYTCSHCGLFDWYSYDEA